MDRVEKLFEGAVYSRLAVRAMAVAAFGRVRAVAEGRRLVAVRALLATAPAVERRASILRVVFEWRLIVRVGKALLPALAEQRSDVRRSQAVSSSSFTS